MHVYVYKETKISLHIYTYVYIPMYTYIYMQIWPHAAPNVKAVRGPCEWCAPTQRQRATPPGCAWYTAQRPPLGCAALLHVLYYNRNHTECFWGEDIYKQVHCIHIYTHMHIYIYTHMYSYVASMWTPGPFEGTWGVILWLLEACLGRSLGRFRAALLTPNG